MKFRSFFISLLALLAVASCQRERENLGIPSIKFAQESLTFDSNGGEAKINVTVSRDWTANVEDDWLGLGRNSGTGSASSQEIEILALPNDGYDREAKVTFVVGRKLITRVYSIYQEGPLGEAPVTGAYFDYSLKTMGQGKYTVEDVVKPEGLEAVWTYDNRYGMKATAYYNSQNYAAESWLVTPPVEIADVETNYVSFTHAGQYFGTITNEATFWISEVATKADEQGWKQLTIPKYPTDWTFVNSGDIDISEYRGKTVKFGFKYLSTASKAGTWEVDALTVSTTPQGTDPGNEQPAEGVIFFNNFDKEAAQQSDSKWPFADSFEGWKNQKGSGAAAVDYAISGVTVRTNSASNSTYSDYDGSGTNNLFFGASSHVHIKNIALGGASTLNLSFGTEMYDNDNKEAPFNHEDFKLYLSNTGEGATWVEVAYAFPAGDKVGRWDKANVSFKVPSGTERLHIYFAAFKGSVYRLDDVTLEKADAATNTLDFSKGVDLGTDPGTVTPVVPSDVKKVTVAEFIAAPESSTQAYQLTGTIGGTINSQYGNFDLADATGTVYVYGLTATNLGYGTKNDQSYASLGLKAGDVITLVGYRGSYGDKVEVVYAYFIKKEDGQSGDNSQDPGPAPEGVIFGNNFDKTTATQSYGNNSNSWPYLDQFDGWKNTVGSGAANVEYEFKGLSARANSASNSQYSLYAGSGANNIFFGSSAHFQVRKIALGEANSFSLSFGSEKYLQSGSVFSKDEFKVYVSDTAGGASWVSLDYTFAGGAMPDGKWDLATAYFTVPQGTEFLNIYFASSVASAYRLDDVTLTAVQATPVSQSVNFSQGVDLGTTAIGQGDDPSVDPGSSTDPVPGTTVQPSGAGTKESPYNIAAVLEIASTLGWTSTSSYDKKGPYYYEGVVSTVTEHNSEFGNITFEMTDPGSSDKFTLYRIKYFGGNNWTENDPKIKVGDRVVVYGEIMNFHGNTPESVSAGSYVYSINGNTGDGNTPSDDPSVDPGSSTDPVVNPGQDDTEYPIDNGDGTFTVSVGKEYLAANKNGELNGMVAYSNESDYGATVVTELRVYKNKSLTLSSNMKMVKVEMTHTANNGTKWGNNKDNAVDAGPGVAYTMSAPETSNTSVIEIPSGTTSLKLTASEDQIRITRLAVTYKAE